MKKSESVGQTNTVISKDGTRIVFDRIGRGSVVMLVDGALCSRALGPGVPLAALLTQHFTVFTYDRRGRGSSGNTPPYSVEREIEDIEAMLNAAGARQSSGAPRLVRRSHWRRPVASPPSGSLHCTKRHSSLTTAVPQRRSIGLGSVRRLRPLRIHSRKTGLLSKKTSEASRSPLIGGRPSRYRRSSSTVAAALTGCITLCGRWRTFCRMRTTARSNGRVTT
jgi:hypothetical protein